ncbi:hypothetical protein [Serratia rubidaea]|uniref:hypothetical protein n=1 Tax=Serratia rubidaea TaxID=61652 RepID=UPI00242E8EBD|nr:hypothetical protein [Serratia rubidaea]MCR1000760.1 hypothetical protein [Serratia rubidaea]
MKKNDAGNLLDTFLPEKFKELLYGHGEIKSATFEADRCNELRLLKIHNENASQSGLNIIGIEDLIPTLSNIEDLIIRVVNARNDEYFIKTYLNKDKSKDLGIIIIKRRKRSDEEIRWHREVLGIKSEPPK